MSGKAREADICLVMFIGLPGSGKTTLCRALIECFKSLCESPSGIVHCAIPICYDDLIPADVFKYENESSRWKEARREVLNYVKNLVCCLKGLVEFNIADDLEMSVREKIIETVQKEKKMSVYIIVDDNMYYRSMRYEYYQLSRLYNLSFCQLFLQCSVSDAMNCNSSREPGEAVSEEIITRMAERLEPPDGRNNPWEKFSLTLPSENWTDTMIKEIICFLNKVAEHPVMSSEDDPEMRQESRIICSTNVTHQVDVTLRKLVGERMKAGSQKDLKHDELQAQSKGMVKARHNIIEGIKMGRIIVPEDICEAIELGQSNARERLQHFLNGPPTIS